MIVVYRLSDLRCVGTCTDYEQELTLNVIPNFGGVPTDYAYIETEETNFHLELVEGNVTIVPNPSQEVPTEPSILERIAALEAEIASLKAT